jgi:protein tyrosine/serine phosphatase
MITKLYAALLVAALCGCKTPSAGSGLADANDGADLSHVTITNFHPVDGHIYRGARPSQSQVAELAGIGVKTILSLETYALEPWDGNDEAQAAADNGLQFLRVEMNPLPIPEPTLGQIHAALAILTDPGNQPAFVHCYHGSDRTGITVGAYRIVADGWTPEQAIAEVESYGHSSASYKYWDKLLYHVQ